MSGTNNMNLTLKVWRQKNAQTAGKFVTYKAEGISPDMSFLEMLDVVNESLSTRKTRYILTMIAAKVSAVCARYISMAVRMDQNGLSLPVSCTCVLHDGQTITIEPWRAAPFPVIKDLAVDRSAFDRIQQAGGYVSVKIPAVCQMPMKYRSQK